MTRKLAPPRRFNIGTPESWKAWASAARDWAAVLYTPVITALLGAVIGILAYAPWEVSTQRQRIGFLGYIGLALVLLVAVGVLWFQRREIGGLRVKTKLGEIDIQTEADKPDPVAPEATLAAIEAVAPPKTVTPPERPVEPEGDTDADQPRR